MAKPNYRQQKNRKEASRKLRQAEKQRRRLGAADSDAVAPDPGAAIAVQPAATPEK